MSCWPRRLICGAVRRWPRSRSRISPSPRSDAWRSSSCRRWRPRIDADLHLGRHDELVSELEALVGEQPARERLAGQLMVALYRSGRQAQALEVYQRIRAYLTEELGLEPGPRLRSLQVQILAQGEELDGGVAASGELISADRQATSQAGHLLAKSVAPSQIPLPPTETIGRDVEIAAVVRLFEGARRPTCDAHRTGWRGQDSSSPRGRAGRRARDP